MKLLIKLAWRNLWRNRRRSLISISSVLFAVLLAILLYSMEQGSYQRMIDSMVKYSTGYIQIQDVLYEDEPSIDNSMLFDDHIHELLEKFDNEIDYYVPRIQNFALVATDDQTRGAMVMGIAPEHELKLNNLLDDLVAGEFIVSGDEDILVAEGLASILSAGVGDTLVLLGQGFRGTTAAGKFRIKGILDLNIPEMNNNTVYLSLETAQWFCVTGDRLTSLIIMPKKPKHTHQLAGNIEALIDKEWYNVLTWDDMLEDLLALMKFDMAGSMVMLMILYIVITFGLYGTILTMMLERQREFAMLLSLGMKRAQLATVCFMESVFLTISGVIAGIAISIPVQLYFYYNPIRLKGDMADAIMDYGFEPIMPFSMDPVVFWSQAKVVLVIAILIGLYPVYKVFRLNIMDVKH
jgi:putative ABC transport system permease protein